MCRRLHRAFCLNVIVTLLFFRKFDRKLCALSHAMWDLIGKALPLPKTILSHQRGLVPQKGAHL
jgi:hypothetical protein